MRSGSTLNLVNEFILYRREKLGSGATGEVYAGKQLRDNAEVAVKVIDLKNVNNEVTQYLLKMEKIAVMSCDSPHVLRGIKVIQNSSCCYIVTELCNGGSLKNQIKLRGPLSEEKSLQFLVQILKGCCSLIGKGILHRDFKPANILLHNGQPKIIDFGYCQIQGHEKPAVEYNVGSPSYMSPQAFLDNQYSQKSQIWAIGVSFYECLNGRTFDDGRNMTDVYKELKARGLSYRAQVSDYCKSIISWCLHPDPKKRPTALELLNSIVSHQKSKPVQSSLQMGRVTFTPTSSEQRKKIYDKRQKLTAQSEYFNYGQYKKQFITEPSVLLDGTKLKPAVSNQNRKFNNPENKLDKKHIVNPPRSKYHTHLTAYNNVTAYSNVTAFDPRQPILRYKQLCLSGEGSLGVSMSDRLPAKENINWMNVDRVARGSELGKNNYRAMTHQQEYGYSRH